METAGISETLVNIYQYTIPYPRVLKGRNTIYKEIYIVKDWKNLNTSSQWQVIEGIHFHNKNCFLKSK